MATFADQQKASPEEMLEHSVENCRRALNMALAERDLTKRANMLGRLALYANTAKAWAEIVGRK